MSDGDSGPFLAGSVMAFLTGLCLLGVGVAIHWEGLGTLFLASRVTGKVARSEVETDQTSGGRRKSFAVAVTVEYSVDGREYRSESKIRYGSFGDNEESARKRCETLAPGKSVSVYYDDQDPASGRVLGDVNSVLSTFLGLVGTVALLVGSFFVVAVTFVNFRHLVE